MPFYRRVKGEATAAHVRVVVLSTDTVDVSRRLLKDNGLAADDVRTVGQGVLAIRGTPTLVLVDGQATVRHVWTGKLQPSGEDDVLESLRRL
jgi:hypothetical protein